MIHKKPPRVSLLIMQRSAHDTHTFDVVVDGRGAPDFTVRACNAEEAKMMVADYIYNELDGKEDLASSEMECDD